jgi:hypothetical protein
MNTGYGEQVLLTRKWWWASVKRRVAGIFLTMETAICDILKRRRVCGSGREAWVDG